MATIDNMRVLFALGTSTTFAGEMKEPNKLYFLQDTQEMYMGSVRYSIGKDVNVQITGSGDTVQNVNWNPDTKTLLITLGEAASAASVRSAIENALSSCITHIYTQRGSAILVDDTDKNNVEISLNIAKGSNAGNVVIEECSDGLRANVDIPATGLVGVKAGDPILSAEGAFVASTLSITTEVQNNKTYVVLKGINGVEISKFDASDFVSTGMLRSVTLEDVAVGGEIHKMLVMTFAVEDDTTSTIQVDLNDLMNVYGAAVGGGLTLDNNSNFSITNSVAPSYGVNTDKTIEFNSTVTLNTITYDAHGLITGTKAITFRIPGLTGSVGTEGAQNKVLTYVSMSDTGVLSGEYMNVVTSIGSHSTDAQIPTAKSVNDLVESAATKWERF